MMKMEKRVLGAILVIVIMMIAHCVPAYAAETVDYMETTISEEFVVDISNPTNKSMNIEIEFVYYNENEVIYTESIDTVIKPQGTITIDAKDYFESSKTTKVEVNVYDSKEVEMANKMEKLAMVIFAIAIILFVCGILLHNADYTKIGEIISTLGFVLIITSMVVFFGFIIIS